MKCLKSGDRGINLIKQHKFTNKIGERPLFVPCKSKSNNKFYNYFQPLTSMNGQQRGKVHDATDKVINSMQTSQEMFIRQEKQNLQQSSHLEKEINLSGRETSPTRDK